MNVNDASLSTRFKIGVFTVLGLLLIGAVTVFVNDKPFWWRPCQKVYINIPDATGLKNKSPVRSLGLQIGYLTSVALYKKYVRLGICITAPVKVLKSTRAYIRGEGFLGDKFVELKPVQYVGGSSAYKEHKEKKEVTPKKKKKKKKEKKEEKKSKRESNSKRSASLDLLDWLIPSANAQESEFVVEGEDIPVARTSRDVQEIVDQADQLVHEMRSLTESLKEAISPEELRATIHQLNVTLEHASKTLSPEGNLTTTAQRVLSKLEDAIEQMRDQFTRVNQGKGSLGRLLNDPAYADEINKAIKNLNQVLSKVGGMRLVVNVGAETIPAYEGSRGWFRLAIWPSPGRYYLLGLSWDPRGKVSILRTTTTVGGVSTVTNTETFEESGMLFTAMLGKVFFGRLDLAIGLKHGDTTLRSAIWLGPEGREDHLKIVNEVYSRPPGVSTFSRRVSDRVFLEYNPMLTVYLKAGIESVFRINGKMAYSFGAGLSFDDDDIKILFSLL